MKRTAALRNLDISGWSILTKAEGFSGISCAATREDVAGVKEKAI
jgi:hypothetical protein